LCSIAAAVLLAVWVSSGCLSSRSVAAEPQVGSAPLAPIKPIAANRRLDVLSSENPARALAMAAREMGDWTIEFTGVALDGELLRTLSSPPGDEPLLRHVRETLGRPVDLDDFVFFLDDVIAAGRGGRAGEPFVIPSGRARSAGILVHPDDVFKNQPRRYAATQDRLNVDEPKEPEDYRPALDGEPLGPRWTARYRNPSTREERLAALERRRPSTELAARIRSLLAQLEGQGADVWLTSTVRRRERGYLMWGAYLLSQTDVGGQAAAVAKLDRLNVEWGLRVPITWQHPGGAQSTKTAARRMADAYSVAYATERGAKNSNHYTGVAVDLVAVALPRKLTLRAPDATVRTFDLSDPANTRDLSLEPELIGWIEKHWSLRKLASDYPHWTDTK